MSEDETISNVDNKDWDVGYSTLASLVTLYKDLSSLTAPYKDLSSVASISKGLEYSTLSSVAALSKDLSSVASISKGLEYSTLSSIAALSKDLEYSTLSSVAALSKDLGSVAAINKDLSSLATISKDFGYSTWGSLAAISKDLSSVASLYKDLGYSTFSSLATISKDFGYSTFGSLASVSEAWGSSIYGSIAEMSEVLKDASTLQSSVITDTLKNVNSFALLTKELVFDNWAKTNTQLFDTIKGRIHFAQQLDTKILPVLDRYNWFISVSLEDSFLRKLSDIIEENPNKLGHDLKNAFLVYFTENNYKNMEKMVMGWADNPLFKPRMKILKDSLNLLKHSHNSYNPANVLIPTLISQIDGFLTDYLIENQFKVIKINKQWIWQDKNMKNNYSREQVYKKIFDSTVQDYSLTNGGSITSLEIGSDFLLNTLFQTAYPRQNLKKPFGLSRHKIMHGENTTYGRKEHLFRTFLVLDFLYGLENVDCK